MNYVLLMGSVVAIALQGVCQKEYSLKLKQRGALTFASLSALFSALFFAGSAVISGGFSMPLSVLPYSLLFALGYGFAVTFVVLACGCGSLALTNLMVSFSPIIPSLYGLMFLDEAFRPTLGLGIAFLLASIVVVNFPGKTGKVTLKWTVFALLSFFGNGLAATVQKVQQLDFGGQYGNEFMLTALLSVVVVTFVCAAVSEKRELPIQIKHGFVLFVLCGILNGLANFLNITLATRMPASLMFPLLSAGGIVCTTVISAVFYKERMSARQAVGLILGIASIVFLNI